MPDVTDRQLATFALPADDRTLLLLEVILCASVTK
jgi:hypothetical protein